MVRTRVAIVEDHPLVMEALKQQISDHPGYELAAAVSHGSQLLDVLRRQPAEILLMDLGMDVGLFDPVSTLRRVRQMYPQMRVVVVSSMAYGETALQVLAVGVDGYVLKNDLTTLELTDVLDRVQAGVAYFSPAIEDLLAVLGEGDSGEQLLDSEEREMLKLAARGHTNREIGFFLGFSEKTMRNRFTEIYRKLGATNRVEAIRRARALGLLAADA